MEKIILEQRNIIQIMPAPPGLRAVFVEEDKTRTRYPVLCFALEEIIIQKPDPERFTIVIPLAWFKGDKIFDDPTSCDNFLGLETSEHDWSSEIKKYFEDKAKKDKLMKATLDKGD